MAKNNQPKQPAAPEENAADASIADAAGVEFPALVESPEGGTSADDDSSQEVAVSAEVSPPQIVKARVLAFCGLGKPNDIIDIDEELAATMPGIVDTSSEAVAYAQSVAE